MTEKPETFECPCGVLIENGVHPLPPFGIRPTDEQLRVEAEERGWFICMKCGALELNKHWRCGCCGFEMPSGSSAPDGACSWCHNQDAERWRFIATGKVFWLCSECGGRDDNPCVERIGKD